MTFIEINNITEVKKELATKQYAAFIFEGIQGVAGIFSLEPEYLKEVSRLSKENGTVLIADEVQSGCGRTGKFFAHQYAGIKPDIITMAKGIANGFPMGAVIISPEIKAKRGALGTTFGGNHLACTAAIAVMKVIKEENLMENAFKMGKYLTQRLKKNNAIKEMRGKGLMIGIELKPEYSFLRDELLFSKKIFTGNAGKSIIRLLPPLCISKKECDKFIESFNQLTK